ncbi:uncharacterized protein KGF55_005110 [Candida pseudojiufengensis]|uniref:uncharacterized protein n=1 Tax=Candida pseudojiufengensis TaxID=497109 RepID=UPI002224B822|nr:uncharacterized protein KGF55_005110 [Candida pseudojiufengensis]KAI5959878.1 hypothetical protein KGF55_005110 [Candida pseudojiufengensis]
MEDSQMQIQIIMSLMKILKIAETNQQNPQHRQQDFLMGGVVEEQASGAINTPVDAEEITNGIVSFQKVIQEEVHAPLDKHTEEFVAKFFWVIHYGILQGTIHQDDSSEKLGYKLKNMAGNTLNNNFYYNQLISNFTFQDSPISTLSEFNKYLRQEEYKILKKEKMMQENQENKIQEINLILFSSLSSNLVSL